MENKVIFWDFDGTLVYPNERFVETLVKSALPIELDYDETKAYLKTIFPWLNWQISYSDKTEFWWESFFDGLSSFWEKNGVDKIEADRINEIYKRAMILDNTYRLYEDTTEVLTKCREKGYRNFLLSNNYPELPLILEDFGLTGLFEGMIVSGNVGYEKPRQELYSYALSLAGNPKIAFMVGDNPVADVKGGKMAGMKTVYVHREDNSDADYNFQTLSEILDII